MCGLFYFILGCGIRKSCLTDLGLSDIKLLTFVN